MEEERDRSVRDFKFMDSLGTYHFEEVKGLLPRDNVSGLTRINGKYNEKVYG